MTDDSEWNLALQKGRADDLPSEMGKWKKAKGPSFLGDHRLLNVSILHGSQWCQTCLEEREAVTASALHPFSFFPPRLGVGVTALHLRGLLFCSSWRIFAKVHLEDSLVAPTLRQESEPLIRLIPSICFPVLPPAPCLSSLPPCIDTTLPFLSFPHGQI